MSLVIPPEVIAAAKDGDRPSLEALLETAWPHAYRIAKSILRNPSAAEDAAQEACASVYRTISSLRRVEAFPAWFYRLVVRQAMADLKKITSDEHDEPATLDPIHAHVERMDVSAALAALPVDLRTVVILHHYAGLNSKEIGSAVGAPSPTVRYRLAQARKRMQRLLEDRDELHAHIPTEAVL